MIEKLQAPIYTWELNGHSRRFAQVVTTYAIAKELYQARRYNALTGKGEQRQNMEPHARKLAVAMWDGVYTPTPISVGLSKKHRESLVFSKDNRSFTLEVNSEDPLPLTDGDHRLAGIHKLYKEAKENLKRSKTDEDKKKYDAAVKAIESLPISATLHIDGDTQWDFVNLQQGRPVDRAHMLSLNIQQKRYDDPSYKLAFETAKTLAKDEESPYFGQIRFDSRGIAPLPLSTLVAKGSSDIGTSLLGLARVGETLKAEDLASAITTVYKALKKSAPAVLESGKPLTTIANGGTKGSATMLIGVATCYVFAGRPKDLTPLIEAAQELNEDLAGNFSGPTKRAYLRKFAQAYFKKKDNLHEGIPTELVEKLSASTFAITRLPQASADDTEEPEQPESQEPAASLQEPAQAGQPADEPEVTTEALDEAVRGQQANPVVVDEAAAPEAVMTTSTGDPWEKEIQG